MLTLFSMVATFGVALYVWIKAGQLRQDGTAHAAALRDVDGAVADAEVHVRRTLGLVAEHFRAPLVGPLTPDVIVKDAVVACPPLREVFLAARGDGAQMLWDVPIREFAAQFAQDMDALMARLRAVQDAAS